VLDFVEPEKWISAMVFTLKSLGWPAGGVATAARELASRLCYIKRAGTVRLTE
jgi:hypothetical protein